jgi:hypothetical protein
MPPCARTGWADGVDPDGRGGGYDQGRGQAGLLEQASASADTGEPVLTGAPGPGKAATGRTRCPSSAILWNYYA